MTTLGEAFVPVRATLDKLDQDLDGARSKIQGAMRGIGKSVQNVGKVALTGIATGLLAIGLTAATVGPQIVGMGADANETASLLESSLGPATEGLNERLSEFAENANRSFFELQAGSSTFVAMTRAMGATQDQASDLSGNFVEMATDLGSFFNVSTENSLQDLQGALAGSSETLQKYGIDVRETTLKQMALDQGLISSASETLPRLARAQLIQQAITEQAADAMGDAARTSDSWQNTMRGLKGRLTDVATEAGQKLIPALTPVLNVVGDLAERAVPILGDVLDRVMPIIGSIAETFEDFVGNLQAGMSPMEAITAAIDGLLGAEAAAWFTETAAAVEAFMARVLEVIEPITMWFEQNVELQDVLIALGIAIGTVIVPALVSILAPIVAIIAVGVALVAAVSAIRQAWETDWGGIRSYLTDAWENTIKPALAALGDWITGTLIPTVQELWNQWVNVIWPSIEAKMQAAWDFIQPILAAIGEWITGTLIPTIQELWERWSEAWDSIQQANENVWGVVFDFFEEIGRWINDNIVPWIEFLQEKWEEKWAEVQEALEAVWSVVQPIWIAIQEWLEDKLPEALTFLQGKWESAMGALEGPVNAIKGVWDTFVDAVKGFWEWISSHDFSLDITLPDLPDWATPGSPLPIHTAWANFEKDMRHTVVRPQFDVPGLNLAGVGGGGSGMAPLQINVDARGATDPQATRRAVKDGIDAALAKMGSDADTRIRTRG